MFKVISPIERPGGGTYWTRCGSAFMNKDESINVYCNLIPAPGKDGFKFQLREITEDELRESAEKRATYQSRTTINPVPATAASDSPVPF
jgi:hypothetical protein